MLQIILIILGIGVIVKGRLKVSDAKVITRPLSIYLGFLFMLYGVGMGLVPEVILYQVIFYTSLVVIAGMIISMGESIAPTEVTTKPSETGRNVVILVIFVVLVITIFYYFSR